MVFVFILGCHLDENGYMPASRIRECLTSLGGTGVHTIDYIDISHGYYQYLDNVCNAAKKGSFFDRARTQHNQRNTDYSASIKGYIYPGPCNNGWLGNDCPYRLHWTEYSGFYCTGKDSYS